MLYNYPGRMGVSMGEAYFTRVSESKNVVAIKESSGDMAQVHMLARRFPNIALSCGWDDQALEFFAWGARELGLRRLELPARPSISRSTRPASSRRISTRGGGSWRR